jgi:hypothetical protein
MLHSRSVLPSKCQSAMTAGLMPCRDGMVSQMFASGGQILLGPTADIRISSAISSTLRAIVNLSCANCLLACHSIKVLSVCSYVHHHFLEWLLPLQTGFCQVFITVINSSWFASILVCWISIFLDHSNFF